MKKFNFAFAPGLNPALVQYLMFADTTRKQDTFSQCWANVGESQTVSEH